MAVKPHPAAANMSDPDPNVASSSDHEPRSAASANAGSGIPLVGGPPLPRGWLGRWPGVTFLLPFVIYMLVGSLEPTPPEPPKANAATETRGDAATTVGEPHNAAESENLTPEEQLKREKESKTMPYRFYPYLYTAKIVLTVAAMLLVIPGYRSFPFRINGVAIAVGLIGGAAWIVLCKLHLEPKVLKPLGLGGLIEMGRRPGFNPLKELAANPKWAYEFLAIRFLGLCLVVPIIEEFFLRGFLMRYVMHIDWFLIPFGFATPLALAVGTAVPMLMHPGELIAAAVWFSLVTWLMLRTRNIWDCIAAHAVTNLMIGLWVLWSGDWFLM